MRVPAVRRATIIDVRVTDVPRSELASPFLVLLDVDKRWRRVRIMGAGNARSAYVHVGSDVLFLDTSFAPARGDTFTLPDETAR